MNPNLVNWMPYSHSIKGKNCLTNSQCDVVRCSEWNSLFILHHAKQLICFKENVAKSISSDSQRFHLVVALFVGLVCTSRICIVTDFNCVFGMLHSSCIYFHTWRIFWDHLPTKSNLRRRRILNQNDDLSCVLCGSREESRKHVLFECLIAHKIGIESFNWLGITINLHSHLLLNLLAHNQVLRGKKVKSVAVTI